MTFHQRLWLCLPPLILCTFDGGLTLLGQSPGYWLDYSLVDELNPVGRWFLGLHPLAFAAALALWGVSFSVAITCLPQRAAFLASLGITLAHALGGATWLARHGLLGWLSAIAFLAAGSYLAEWSWRKAGWLGDPGPGGNVPSVPSTSEEA